MVTLDEFVELIYKTRDKELIKDFLLGLTTPYERKVLLRRVELVNRLLNGESQHEIAKDLGLGVSTVSRGAKELRLGRFKVLRK